MDESLQQSNVRDRESFGNEVVRLAQASEELLEPLRGLNEVQVGSIRILTYLIQVWLLAGRPQFRMASSTLQQFADAFDTVCPDLGKELVSRDPCFDATVAYVSALAKCDEDGRSEDDCPESWGPASQSLGCAIAMVEATRHEVTEILGGHRPPRPIPDPIR